MRGGANAQWLHVCADENGMSALLIRASTPADPLPKLKYAESPIFDLYQISNSNLLRYGLIGAPLSRNPSF